MSRKCLIYRPVAEFPLSDPDFSQEIQERFTRPNSNLIQPTQPEERHLTILGAREYPKVLHPSRLRIHLPEQSQKSLELNVVGARMLGECALTLVFNDLSQTLPREERRRIKQAFIEAGATTPHHKKFKPHVTIAKIPRGISRRHVIRWTENMLPTDPTVIVGGITQNNLSGREFNEQSLIEFDFSNEGHFLDLQVTGCMLLPPLKQKPEKKGCRHHSHS